MRFQVIIFMLIAALLLAGCASSPTAASTVLSSADGQIGTVIQAFGRATETATPSLSPLPDSFPGQNAPLPTSPKWAPSTAPQIGEGNSIPTPDPSLKGGEETATAVAVEMMVLGAQRTVAAATDQAGQATQAVIELTATQAARQTEQAGQATQTAAAMTAQAQTAMETQQAISTERAWSLTGTPAAVAVMQTLSAGTVTAQAREAADAVIATAQAQASAYDAEQLELSLERQRLTNGLLAYAPWLGAALLVGLLLLLAWRLGLSEVFRRAWVHDAAGNPVYLGGHVEGADPARSSTPVISVSGPEVEPEVQAVVTARAQWIQMAERMKIQSERQGLPTPNPSLKGGEALLPMVADWGLLAGRQPGVLLLGVGSDGPVIARRDTPHVLVAGQTGSGKSTEMRSIITQALLDGMRVTILDKSGWDFEVFRDYATVITLDAREAKQAIAELISYMKAAWDEVVRRQRERISRPVDLLVVDELDNWQDSAQDADLTARRLWQYPRMIAREGRKVGINLLVASQNPTAANISLDLRRNCTPVAFRLADAAASRVILDDASAVGLDTGRFVARLGTLTRGVGFNPSDDDILQMLRSLRPAGRPEWLVEEPTSNSSLKGGETWQEKAKRLYADGMAISRVAREVGRNYYDTEAVLKTKGE